MEFRGKRILIFQQRDWGRRIGHFLARKLQGEGCRLAALTFKNESHLFVLRQKQVKYDLIVSIDEIMTDPSKFLDGDDISFAEICADLGVDTLWPFIYSLRNHVTNYGEKYFYSFRQNVPDEEIVVYVKALYISLKRFFDEFHPETILSPNFSDIAHIMCNLMAEKHGAAMIAPNDSKIRGISIFSHSFHGDKGPFCDRIGALNSGQADSTNRGRAMKYIAEFRQQFKDPKYSEQQLRKKSRWKRLRQTLSPLRKIFNWYVKKHINYLPNLGVTIDYKPPRIILRDFFAERRYRKFAENYPYYSFEKVEKFVYFPLQVQPEATIDVQAPYFTNQVEFARLVAMSLPGDYTLVVKEHPAMVGFRPPDALDKLARTANIKLIDFRIPSEKVLQRTALVVSPSSTTIAEAAFYNKPAIQLGDLGTTLKLPNVFKHSDLPSLPRKIKEVLAKDLKTADYERRLENYVAAAYDTGFVFDYFGVWYHGEKGNMENLWQVYRKEILNVL